MGYLSQKGWFMYEKKQKVYMPDSSIDVDASVYGMWRWCKKRMSECVG